MAFAPRLGKWLTSIRLTIDLVMKVSPRLVRGYLFLFLTKDAEHVVSAREAEKLCHILGDEPGMPFDLHNADLGVLEVEQLGGRGVSTLATVAPVAEISGYASSFFNNHKEVMPMLFIRRPVFFRLGRLEVFAEGWKHQSGEPWFQLAKGATPAARELQVWMPGLHLVVCLLRRPGDVEVTGGGAAHV